MRKRILPALLVFLLSCGSSSSFEGDVKKAADMACKVQKLSTKMQGGDATVQKELDALIKEAEAYGEEMDKKYKIIKENKEMEDKAEKIYNEIMAKCN